MCPVRQWVLIPYLKMHLNFFDRKMGRKMDSAYCPKNSGQFQHKRQ